jgi:hypothetical protein
MTSHRPLKSVFKSVLVGGSVIALTTLPSGCSGINNKVLSREQAQEIISKYVTDNNGNVGDIQGVVQNEGASQAVATVTISDFNYTISNGHKVKYTGKAAAQFSRYTDGKWSMTDVTINPDDVFSARHFTTNVQDPRSEDYWFFQKVTLGDGTEFPIGLLLSLSLPLIGIVFSIYSYYSTQKKSRTSKQS